MDEETQAPAENVQAVEDSSPDTSPVDETNTSESTNDEGQSEQEQVDAPAAEDTKEDSERKPTRAERRIRELSDKVRQLEGRPNQFGFNPQPSPVAVDPGQELTQEEYQQHLAQTAQGVVAPQLEQLRTELETKEAKRNFDADSKQIETQYPELSDASPVKSVLEKQIAEEFQEKAFRLVGVDPITGEPQYRLDPSVRLADIAAAKVADARAIAELASADMNKAVANDADQAAIKPSGNTTASDKKFEDLSIEEMERRLGVVRQ